MTPAEREAAIRAAVDALVAAILAAATPEAAGAPDRLLSVDEAAAALGVGRSMLYTEMDAGRLRSLHVGRRRLIPSGAIVDFIQADVASASRLGATETRSGASPSGAPRRRKAAA